MAQNEYLSDKARQRKQQQEAARARRHSERKAKRKNDAPAKSFDETPYRLVLMLDSAKRRDGAYAKLFRNEALTPYYPKFKYHDACQLTTMRGALSVVVPFGLAQRIEASLAPEWRKASVAEIDQYDVEERERDQKRRLPA